MKSVFQTNAPLSQPDIYKLLKKLRLHAASKYSNYSVASIAEIKKSNDLYFYSSGVNVENDEHNRLTIHAEQNAIATAVTLLGSTTTFSNLWIMAAPVNATPNDTSNIAGKSCGHCRQILVSLAERDAEIYTVTLDGRFGSPDSFERNFLPDCFSENNLNLSSEGLSKNSMDESSKIAAWDIVQDAKKLNIDEIANYLKLLSPHIISDAFKTSSITACILKCNKGGYAAGALVQDIAFLTTDAIFSALGNAVTQFGQENLRFDEIHLLSSSLEPNQLSLAEIETLSFRYTHRNTQVYFHTQDGQYSCFTLLECMNARTHKVEQLLS